MKPQEEIALITRSLIARSKGGAFSKTILPPSFSSLIPLPLHLFLFPRDQHHQRPLNPPITAFCYYSCKGPSLLLARLRTIVPSHIHLTRLLLQPTDSVIKTAHSTSKHKQQQQQSSTSTAPAQPRLSRTSTTASDPVPFKPVPLRPA
jgi:hypothetical protein